MTRDPAAVLASRSDMAVLEVIRTKGPVTRGVIARSAHLGVAMVARTVTRLKELELVQEVGRSDADGPGRQAYLLAIHPDMTRVVGVSLVGEVMHLVLGDATGAVLAERCSSLEKLHGQTPAVVVDQVAAQVRALVTGSGLTLPQLGAVGLAITGVVDSGRGICLTRTHTPGWENIPLGADLTARLQVPVLVEETTRAQALAESRIGSGRGVDHFLYVEAGAAIGAGIVIDGKPFSGPHGLAGELGHVTVDPDGPLCRCGNRGCVQASASARAIVARAHDLLHRNVYSSLAGAHAELTLDHIARAAERGDKLALGLLNDAGEQLGEAISMALNLLGLELVVLGGTVIASSQFVMDAIARIVRLRVLPMLPGERRLIQAQLGANGAALGVMLQALDWLFDRPQQRLLSPR